MKAAYIIYLMSVLSAYDWNANTSTISLGRANAHVPDQVLRLVDSYIGSLYGQNVRDINAIRNDFLLGFIDGYIRPNAVMTRTRETLWQGFIAGQNYRRNNPTIFRETMEGFGYIATETEGIWTRSFEHSEFRPNCQPTEIWWLSYIGDAKPDIPEDMKIRSINIIIVGYLSPAGRYGHLGMYVHEIIATSISSIKEVQ